jgi:DNA-binding NarL/FixJ family response regulator
MYHWASECDSDHLSPVAEAYHRVMGLGTAKRVDAKPKLRIALVESDPLRSVGIRSLLAAETNLTLISASLPEIATLTSIDIVLIGDRRGQNLLDTISGLKAMRTDLRIIVIGPSTDHEVMLNVIVSGAKGYVFDGAQPSEFVQAIQAVSRGSVWVPRRVLSIFIERAITLQNRVKYRVNGHLTDRERQVLNMLVTGLSNKEIGAPLGIVERTVKAHIARMMHKVGVHNRIELSVHAVAHSLVSVPAN